MSPLSISGSEEHNPIQLIITSFSSFCPSLKLIFTPPPQTSRPIGSERTTLTPNTTSQFLHRSSTKPITPKSTNQPFFRFVTNKNLQPFDLRTLLICLQHSTNHSRSKLKSFQLAHAKETTSLRQNRTGLGHRQEKSAPQSHGASIELPLLQTRRRGGGGGDTSSSLDRN